MGYAAVCDAPAVPLPYSRFRIDGSSLPDAAQLHEQIRQARAALKLPAAFDFEVLLPECDAESLDSALDYLRNSGHPPQLAAPARISGDLAEVAAVARKHQVTLSLQYHGEHGAAIQDAAKATLGRVSFRVQNAEEAEFVCGELV
jgi:sugar phosphate isomerase/epimerase